MLGEANPVQVYLATGPTDMRKAMNGLALIVEAELDLNPLDGSLFVFCNRRRNILKVLYYDHNGFCLFMKRLESTTFRLKEPGRDHRKQSFMWVFRRGDPEKPMVLYHYSPSRSGDIPKQILGDYQGFIQTDGYGGYDALGKQEGVIHVGCWAHARRKFTDAIKALSAKKRNKGTVANQALRYIQQLYAIETRGRSCHPMISKPFGSKKRCLCWPSSKDGWIQSSTKCRPSPWWVRRSVIPWVNGTSCAGLRWIHA